MKKVILLVVVLLSPWGLVAKTTTVYHTSDTHGFFFPRNGQGGFAALAAVVKSGPQPYLLLDSGDFANGTVETRNSKGLKAVQMMNYMHYDATTLGNHEFDFKASKFPALVEALDFPLLAANFLQADTREYPPHILPYLITEKNGVKFAIIGLGNRTPTNPATGYYFTKPLVALEQALTEAEKQHPQVVIVLVHDALEDADHGTQEYVAQIAQRFAGRVHIVLGGHAHQVVQNHYINGVLYVESGGELQSVSRITVTTHDETGAFERASSELIPLVVNTTDEDPQVKAFAETLREPGVDIVLGTTTDVFFNEPVAADRLDSPLDNWMADLMQQYSGADIGLQNNGSTRADMPKGPITRRDLIEITPYDNTVIVIKLRGSFIKNFVKKVIAEPYSFCYAGLQIYYKKDINGKIVDVEILHKGKHLKNHTYYTVAMNAYTSRGENEGYLFKPIPADAKHQFGTTTVWELMEQALRNGPVVPPATGRILERN